MLQPQMDQLGHELQQVLLLGRGVPTAPRYLVVLAVGIVVALLGALHLVAAADHRDALADQQRGEQVAQLPLAQVVDIANGCGAFHAAVP